jgi:hypothetical protein
MEHLNRIIPVHCSVFVRTALRYILFTSLLAMGTLLAKAQVKAPPFTVPDSLQTDIRELLGRSLGTKADSLLTIWESTYTTFDDSTKLSVFNLSKALYKKGYRAVPLAQLYGCLATGFQANLVSAAEMSNFMKVAEITAMQYNGKVLSNFLATAKALFQRPVIYQSRFSSLDMEGGTLVFSHVLDDELAKQKDIPGEATFDDSLTDKENDEKKKWFEGMDYEDDKPVKTEPIDPWAEEENTLIWDEEENTLSWDDEEVMDEEMPMVSFIPGPDYELPAITGPLVTITGARFIIRSIYDTTIVENVEGTLLMKNNLFIGKNSYIDWPAHLRVSGVRCELNVYTMKLNDTRIEGHEAKLVNQDWFSEPVEGTFVFDSHLHNRKRDKAIYPVFKSFSSRHTVAELAPNLYFNGGISLVGSKFSSQSDELGFSRVQYVQEGVRKFSLESKKPFILQDTLLSNPQAKVIIHYNESDSLWHPASAIKFFTNIPLLQARKDKNEYKMSMYTDTRNDVFIGCEFLEWNMNKDSIDLMILNARDRIPLVVESKDFYDRVRYQKLQGTLRFHPLQMACHYSLKERKQSFSSAELAKANKQNPDVVRGAMLDLARMGYVDYDFPNDRVKITRKGFLYYYASIGREGVDFDNMRMNSRVNDRPNLTISINSSDFRLSGVKQFMISDSMKVLVTPKDGQVNLKDGRNTTFGGEMRAGNFIFRGPDLTYNYDSFMVDLKVVDSISILVTHKDGQLRELKNNIVNTGGTLYISDPKNKSGKKNAAQYPILDATKGGTIFFDRKEILKGAYDKRIRFDMPPFEIDSLNESNTDIIALYGTFKTGGIFPDFQETMGVDKTDFSFGFKRNMGRSGVPLYEGKGKYYDNIQLNNKGIRGNGRIDYLTGSFYSKDFIFYSDSVKAFAESGEIRFDELNHVTFPSVKMNKYEMRWLVHSDTMILKNNPDNLFEIYDPNTSFTGELLLTNLGLKGKGIIETPESINESKFFDMEGMRYNSMNSYFKIKSLDPKIPAMIGEEVEVDYDLSERLALIKIQDVNFSSFTFPYTKYATNISQVAWNLDQNSLVMTVDKNSDTGLGRFISRNIAQDSLEVYASDAVYDLTNHTLNLDGVPGIMVANIRVIPKDGEVFIRENADMQELQDAVVELNSFNKYHILRNATIKVHSRRKFSGEGTYFYNFGTVDTFQVRFSDFDTKPIAGAPKGDRAPRFTTTARGRIDEDTRFGIVPGFLYKGDVRLVDLDKYLHFKGAATLDLDRPGNKWFAYQSDSEETHGVFIVDENLKEFGYPTKLTSGLYLSIGERKLYASLVEFEKERVRDVGIFQAQGNLTFDPATKIYAIMPPERATNRSFRGSKYLYDFYNKKIEFEGPLNLLDNTEDYQVVASGLGKGEFEANKYSINAAIQVNFRGESKATDIMGADLKSSVEGLDKPNYNEYDISVKMAQLLEEKNMQSFYDSYRNGEENFSKFFSTGLMVPDVNLRWSDEFNGFYSIGDFALGNVFKTNLNAKVSGYIEIPKSLASNVIKIFIMVDRDTWYYFSFEKSGIRATSSNPAFNNELKGRSNTGLVKSASLDEIMGFVNGFRMNYLGINDPLDIVIGTDFDPFASDSGLDSRIKKETFKDMGTPPTTADDDDDDGF